MLPLCTLVDVVVVYNRDVGDKELYITDKARARRLTVYEIEERGTCDLRVLRALHTLVLQHNINLTHGDGYNSERKKAVYYSHQTGSAMGNFSLREAFDEV